MDCFGELYTLKQEVRKLKKPNKRRKVNYKTAQDIPTRPVPTIPVPTNSTLMDIFSLRG